MKRSHILLIAFFALAAAFVCSCQRTPSLLNDEALPWLHIEGRNVVSASGDTFYIQGVNLGHAFNPEGYMMQFSNCNSPRLINDMLSELVGPDEAAAFWQAFKEAYITEDDIRYIASVGANTIRLPFHYAMFTDQDYMGCQRAEGFARMDSIVAWCERARLYVVLDMHDCPGGQTGDNIDDSYGYPWLMLSEPSQALFCSLWRQIADHYKDNPVVLGYELMNEPVATYFEADYDTLNAALLPLYERCIDSIRTVDPRHIILLGGAQWNGNFRIFTHLPSDPNILYACHRYGHPATEDGILDFLQWQDSLNVPMCMTETGHASDEWYALQAATLRRHDIGLLFWPYKKLGGSCWMHVGVPEGWDVIRQFAAADRSSYAAIRAARTDCAAALASRPDASSSLALHSEVSAILAAYLDSVRFASCHPDTLYSRVFLPSRIKTSPR